VKVRTLKAQDLESTYLAHFKPDGKPDKGYWVVFVGTVNDVSIYPDKKGRYTIYLSQKGMSFFSTNGKANSGVKVLIAKHVWNFMGGSGISKFAKIAIIGNIERREQWTKQTGSIAGQYEPPELNAWGFFVMESGKPTKMEEDVVEGSLDVADDAEDFDNVGGAQMFGGEAGVLSQAQKPVPVPKPVPASAKPAAAAVKPAAVKPAAAKPAAAKPVAKPAGRPVKSPAKPAAMATKPVAELPAESDEDAEGMDFF